MSDENVVKFPQSPEQPPLLIGPFEEWRVMVDGRIMPHLTGFREGDNWWLVVDHRLASGPFTEEGARQAARLAGNAMAVISGYPFLGAETKKMPFAPQGARLDARPEDQPPCTCHPDEAPRPCQHKYAHSDCVRSWEEGRTRPINPLQ